MLQNWQPGTEYTYGDVVLYQGVQYKIIQPHGSLSNWTPPETPALWGRIEGGEHNHGPYHETSGQRGQDCTPQPCAPSCNQDCKPQPCTPSYDQDCKSQPCTPSYNQPPQQQQQTPQSGVTPTHEEHQKHWYDFDDKTKQELKIGGGILALGGVLAGGYHAYKEHGKSEEEKKAHLWSQNNWLQDARQRTQAFRSGNYTGPVAWVLNEGKVIPPDAIEGGFERGAPLYICRAYYEGGLMIGKACSVFKQGAVIGYKKEEIHLRQYEILVGNPQAVRWVNLSGKFSLASLGGLTPVEGGREPGGAPQYIAQAPYHGAVHPGKACEEFGHGCYIPYDSTEKSVEEYAVLVYNR